jgi:Transglycosylase SLT domain
MLGPTTGKQDSPMRARLLGLPAVALAAGLPTLLAGLLGATAPLHTIGPDDSIVRTVTVDPPPEPPTDEELGLDGAHPPTNPAPQVTDGAGKDGGGSDSRGVPVRVSGTALPARVLLAYRRAAAEADRVDPICHLSWSLLAGIGQVESGHAYRGAVDPAGRTLNPILGPVLNGAGDVAAIADTDGGTWDGDTTWDRAVGPMQFIPSSWAVWGRDGDGDGKADPSDVDDASLAAASYLCAGDRDLSKEKDRRSAVFSYNHSWDYVDLVLAWADAYATGVPLTTGLLGGGTSEAAGPGPAPVRGERPGEGPVLALPAPTADSLAPPTAREVSPTQPPASAAPNEPAPAPAPAPAPSTAAAESPAPSATPTVAPTGPEPCPTASPPAETPSPSSTPTPTDSGSPNPSDSPTGTATPTPTAPDPSCPTP